LANLIMGRPTVCCQRARAGRWPRSPAESRSCCGMY
jgi:hypothetical protein